MGAERRRIVSFGFVSFVAFHLGIRAGREGLPDSGLARSKGEGREAAKSGGKSQEARAKSGGQEKKADSRRAGRCMAVAQFRVRWDVPVKADEGRAVNAA